MSPPTLITVAVLSFAFCRAIRAQPPAAGVALLPDEALGTARRSPGNDASVARFETIEVAARPFVRALRATTVQQPRQSWDIQVVMQTTGPVRKNEVCLLSFWARGPASQDESGDAWINAFLQQNHPPHQKVVSAQISVNQEWRHVAVAARVPIDLPEGGSNVAFHLGFQPQTVELADVRLVKYGPEVDPRSLSTLKLGYKGREENAPWRAAAAERIERVRKGDLVVRVVDAAGRPVPDADVHVAMRRHAFGFGAAVTARNLCRQGPDGDRYRETVERLYNKVVFENDLKWGPWDVAKSNRHDRYRQEWRDRAFAWLNERGIEVRGHYVTWAPLDKAKGKYTGKPNLLRRDLWAHMADKLPAVGARVGEWDAVNHIVGWGETFEEVCGGKQIYADVIKHTRELTPGIELWVNEGQVLPSGRRIQPYVQMIQYLIDHDAKPDGIGFMGHFGATSLTPPGRLWQVFERFATLVPNLQLTELDVQTGGDEELQADYLRDVMTLAFSHPAFQGIVMWGFWEGKHWKPDAALYRKDWSIKPNGQAWLDLVGRDWRTDEAGQTGPDGVLRTRGFLGDYSITVTAGGKTRSVLQKLERTGADIEVQLP